MVIQGYPLLLLLLLLSAIFGPFLLLVSQIVQFKSPSALKYSTYESGMELFGDAKIRFDVKFYMYALLFILFDIETVFLLPWAISFGKGGNEAIGLTPEFLVVEMFLFIGILALGLVYAWRKGALRWQ